MEEDASNARRRRELTQEKNKLAAFSERLDLLVLQIEHASSTADDQHTPFDPHNTSTSSTVGYDEQMDTDENGEGVHDSTTPTLRRGKA